MNDQDFEQLSQYLDGELDAFSTRCLEQRLADEPELQSLLAQLRAQDDKLRAAYRGTDQAPERISALLQSNVVAFPRQRGQRPTWQYAVAASLVAAAGLLLTPSWQQEPSGSLTLAEILEEAPSTASDWKSLGDDRRVRPVLSFKDRDGNWCREYLLVSGDQGSRGISCRQNDSWNTVILAEADIPGSSSEFRPAGAGDTDVIAQYMADRADGIALSASEEARLIASDWQ